MDCIHEPEVQVDLPLQAQPPPSLAQHCNSLIGVSRRISAHRDPQELFQNLPAELRQIVQFDGLAIVLHEEITNAISLRILDLSGHRAAGLQSPMADQEAMLGWIQQQVEPLVVRLPDQQSLIPWLDFPKDLGIRTVCALPLNTIHHRLGSLILASSDAFAYSAERVHLLSLLADRTALAVDDALAHEASRAAQAELQSKNERLKLLLDLNNAVVSNLQLRELLRAIASSVRQVMKCDSVGVALPDPDDQRLRIHAVDFPEGKGLIREESKVPSADGPTSRAFRHGETIALDAHALSGLDAGDLAVAEGFRALCDIPLVSRNRSLGVLCLGRLHDSPFTGDEVEFLRQVAAQVAIAVENALAYRQIADLKDKLAQEKLYLEDEIRSQMNFDSIVGNSAALQKVLHQVETVAPTDSTVLIYGETGVGKELVARAIHNLSSRSRSAFVKLNCAAIPTGLLESEMFGHEKGAFTGAIAQRIGRFELAHEGSVFLDEVGEIALELQPKLLRVLQEREFERLGSSRTLRTNARLIASTNRDLAAMVKEQKFRMDLYYRLDVFPIHVPPLRERREDIPLLVRHFVQQFARRMNRTIDTIPSETMNVLVRYQWPGNIRELQNLLERAVILSAGPVLKVPLADLETQPMSAATGEQETLEEAERRTILDALQRSNWVVSGRKGAAALLGLKRTTLQWRMDKLGIRRSGSGERGT
jgi:formate hydrogenlyase transcriptional activator